MNNEPYHRPTPTPFAMYITKNLLEQRTYKDHNKTANRTDIILLDKTKKKTNFIEICQSQAPTEEI